MSNAYKTAVCFDFYKVIYIFDEHGVYVCRFSYQRDYDARYYFNNLVKNLQAFDPHMIFYHLPTELFLGEIDIEFEPISHFDRSTILEIAQKHKLPLPSSDYKIRICE